MSVLTVLATKALTGLDAIITAVQPGLLAQDFPVSSAVKELVQGNLAARDRSGGRPGRPVWQARAAMQLLQPWWKDDAANDGSVFEAGQVVEFVSNLLTKIDDLWSDLSSTAAGDVKTLDNALAELAAVSASGVNPRLSSKDASVQAAIDLLAGIRGELRA